MTSTAQLEPTLSLESPESRLGERFRKLRPHARGGLGEVFVARDEELSREVALKQMLPQYTHSNACRERFVREAEITGGLEHPGIVPVYGLGTCGDGRPYYAMRFIRGETLKDAILRFHDHEQGPQKEGERSVELRRLLQRMLDVCHAVDYAHSRGVLHRDLKPSNIMLGKYGETLVVDWGLAKAAGHDDVPLTDIRTEPALVPRSGSSSEPTALGKAIGTPSYMSPEQAAGRVDRVTHLSDVYSLGATLYELLTGRPPYVTGNIGEVLRRVQEGKFLRPRLVQPDVPAGLEAICLKAMSHDPAQRYTSVQSLAEDIERWLADEPVQAHNESQSERVDRWLRHHRAWANASALVVFLLAAAASVALAIVHTAQRETADAHAAEQIARQEAIVQRNVARKAVDQFEGAVAKLRLLADHPELTVLRDSPEYQQLVKQAEHTQAMIPDAPPGQ
jgi:serine/threonine protein kinase